MRPMRTLLLVVLLAVGLVRPAVALAVDAPRARRVLVVSIDGLGWELWRTSKDRTPILSDLASRGVSGRSRTVFPSMTWPSHATLVTGKPPSAHRVVGNRHYDRVRKQLVHAYDVPMSTLIAVDTIFHAARRAGKRSAALNWPGTREASAIDFQVPEVYAQKSFDAWSTAGFPGFLEQHGIPWGRYAEHSKDDGFVLDAVTRDATRAVVRAHRPDMVWAHFLVVDTLLHKYGPEAPEIGYALEHADAMLGGLLGTYRAEGLLAETAVLVVSDHGFAQSKRVFDADKVLFKAGLLKSLKRLDQGPVRTVTNGQALYVYVLDTARRDELAAAAGEALKLHPEIERLIQPKEYRGLDLPAASDDRMPDLIALGRTDVRFGRIEKGDAVSRPTAGGMHGYLPDHPALRPAFIAAGPGIRARAEPIEIDNLEVAPLVATLLDIPFGVALSERAASQVLGEGVVVRTP
jgi:predicted AlkP superfamily pyrophosphatase or phosphodiesterase